MRLAFLTAAVVLFVLFSRTQALAGSPAKQLEKTLNLAISVLGDPALDDAAKNERFTRIIESRVDFETISRKVLGRHWPANASRTHKFVPLFKRLLERNYIRKVWFKDGRGVRVEFLSQSFDGDTARVETILFTTKDGEYPISYRLQGSGGEWKIVDISVIGMSMVSSYRKRFNEFLAKKSFDELLDELERKVGRDSAAAK